MLILTMVVFCLAGIIPCFFGIWVMVQLARPLKSPADKSNRINRIRLFWFALTRPELFAENFPWMKRDELDNVKAGNEGA
jgi:hypothetical protein